MSDKVHPAGNVVKVRLFIDGKEIHFDLPGPLVTMPAKTRKGSK